jgi:hypothetical protein
MTKRRLLTAIIGLVLVVSAFAVDKNLEKDITMVSYEQSWRDSEGTLALKNNTNEDIKNVVFVITYLDMSGQELDYQEFAEDIDIAPGMTRKLDIPAYEHDRSYHYYKSAKLYDNTSFKIKFQLKDYNTLVESVDESDIDVIPELELPPHMEQGDDYHNDGLFLLLVGIVFLFVIGISIALFIIVALMAKNRNRNVVLWVLLSIIASPLLIILILLAIGNDETAGERE